MLLKVYGDEALSRSTVFEWCKRFKNGRNSAKDVEKSLKRDHCLSARLIKDMAGISESAIHGILTEDFKKIKVCAKFVPHPPTLLMMSKNVQEFLGSEGFVVMNRPPYSPDSSSCVYFLFYKFDLIS